MIIEWITKKIMEQRDLLFITKKHDISKRKRQGSITAFLLVLISCIMISFLVLSGCASKEVTEGIKDSLDWLGQERLKMHLPCFLICTSSDLRLVDREGKRLDTLFKLPKDTYLDFVAFDLKSLRFALFTSKTYQEDQGSLSPPAVRVENCIYFLENNDYVRKAYRLEKSGEIRCPSFTEGGDLLWVEWDTEFHGKINSFIKKMDRDGNVKEVEIQGGPTSFGYIDGLYSFGEGNKFAVVYKIRSSEFEPDFEVFLAKYQEENFKVYSSAYGDDFLETGVAPIKDSESIIFSRVQHGEAGGRINTDLVRVDFVDGKPIEKIIVEDSGADPGYAFRYRIEQGPGGWLIFRSAQIASGDEGRLSMLNLKTMEIEPLDIFLKPDEHIWLWLE